MMMMTLNFKIKQTKKQTNLFWDLAVYQDLSLCHSCPVLKQQLFSLPIMLKENWNAPLALFIESIRNPDQGTQPYFANVTNQE